MNYTIKTSGIENVVIGPQTFTQTAVDLFGIACLETQYLGELNAKVKSGQLTILLKGVEVSNNLAVISKISEMIIKENKEDDLLKQDFQTYKTCKKSGIIDSDMRKAVFSYQNHSTIGYAAYEKKRAKRVKDLDNTLISKSDSFHINQKTIFVKVSIATGDWQTALDFANIIEVDAIFTQVLKDEFIAEIQGYIDANY
jgi:hypothetical protein